MGTTAPDEVDSDPYHRDSHGFGWTTGRDPHLTHEKRIAVGGYGEVHQLYCIPKSEFFARKLIRHPGSSRSLKDIENEIRAIEKIWWANWAEPYYFIDMELCDMNLENYIYRTSPSTDALPRFVKTASSSVKASQIWNVMRQVVSGVVFIHSHNEIHRDVKPSNILYSRKHSVWKLADFGFTSEGTSQSFQSTSKARGTAGYRSPELLSEDRPSFNNKVDIWSLGCILYELAIGKKAFSSDYALVSYQLSGTGLEVNLDDSFDEPTRDCITKHIHQTLQIEPSSRPSAASLLSDFTKYCPPSNSSQGTYVEIHHEFNPSRHEGFHTASPPVVSATVAVSESNPNTTAAESLDSTPDGMSGSRFVAEPTVSEAQQSPGIRHTLDPTMLDNSPVIPCSSQVGLGEPPNVPTISRQFRIYNWMKRKLPQFRICCNRIIENPDTVFVLFNICYGVFAYYFCQSFIFVATKVVDASTRGSYWFLVIFLLTSIGSVPINLFFSYQGSFDLVILRRLPVWIAGVVRYIFGTAGIWVVFCVLVVWHRAAFRNGCDGWELKALVHATAVHGLLFHGNVSILLGTATIYSVQGNYTMDLIWQNEDNIFIFSVNTSFNVHPPIAQIQIDAWGEAGSYMYDNITGSYTTYPTGALSLPDLDLEPRDPSVPAFYSANPPAADLVRVNGPLEQATSILKTITTAPLDCSTLLVCGMSDEVGRFLVALSVVATAQYWFVSLPSRDASANRMFNCV